MDKEINAMAAVSNAAIAINALTVDDLRCVNPIDRRMVVRLIAKLGLLDQEISESDIAPTDAEIDALIAQERKNAEGFLKHAEELRLHQQSKATA